MNNEIEYLGNMINTANQLIVSYGFQFIGAVIILVLGWQIAKWAARFTLKICERARLDITLSRFFANLAKILVWAFVIIIALGKFGITIAPFIAALGAVAFGGTLALQGPLSNYGAGLTIVLTRPFVVGDTIKIQGFTGVVDEIKLAYTLLSNENGELITIPNKQIVGEILSNSHANLVVETTVRIDYRDDAERAIGIIRDILHGYEEVAKQPPPLTGIEKFGESAIEIGLRYWVPTRHYFETQYQVNGRINKVFREQGIRIAYPRTDVHVTNNGA